MTTDVGSGKKEQRGSSTAAMVIKCKSDALNIIKLNCFQKMKRSTPCCSLYLGSRDTYFIYPLKGFS